MKRILLALGLLISVTAKADNTSDLMGLGMPGALAGKIGGWLGDNDLVFTASSYEIVANSSNGSDTKNVCISGGGDCGDQGRGGYFQAFGTDAVGADAGDIYLVPGTGGDIITYGDMVYNDSVYVQKAGTVDGVDTKGAFLVGGGDGTTDRGGMIFAQGNEVPAEPGWAGALAGNVTNSKAIDFLSHTTSRHSIMANYTPIVETDYRGAQFIRAYVPTMAATPVAGTNDILGGISVIPTAAANTAALLPTPIGANLVEVKRVINNSGASVRVKAGGTNTINGATAGGYIVLANLEALTCETTSATNHRCKLDTGVLPTPAGP